MISTIEIPAHVNGWKEIAHETISITRCLFRPYVQYIKGARIRPGINNYLKGTIIEAEIEMKYGQGAYSFDTGHFDAGDQHHALAQTAYAGFFEDARIGIFNWEGGDRLIHLSPEQVKSAMALGRENLLYDDPVESKFPKLLERERVISRLEIQHFHKNDDSLKDGVKGIVTIKYSLGNGNYENVDVRSKGIMKLASLTLSR